MTIKYLCINLFCIGALIATDINAQVKTSPWVDDLLYLAENLPGYHKDFYKIIEREKFDNLIEEKLSKAKNYSFTDFCLAVYEIMATLKVAHSYPDFNHYKNESFHIFPVFGTWYSDGFYITKTAPEYTHLLGKKLIQIENHPITHVLSKISKFVSAENEAWLKKSSWIYFAAAEALMSCDVIRNLKKARFTFDLSHSEEIYSVPENKLKTFVSLEETLPIPELYSHYKKTAYYAFHFVRPSKLLYFQYNLCREDSKLPFRNFNDSLFTFISKNDVQKIVLDLRYNEGGNSEVLHLE